MTYKHCNPTILHAIWYQPSIIMTYKYCNPRIPHAKWYINHQWSSHINIVIQHFKMMMMMLMLILCRHVQIAASLTDVSRLMDSVLRMVTGGAIIPMETTTTTTSSTIQPSTSTQTTTTTSPMESTTTELCNSQLPTGQIYFGLLRS